MSDVSAVSGPMVADEESLFDVPDAAHASAPHDAPARLDTPGLFDDAPGLFDELPEAPAQPEWPSLVATPRPSVSSATEDHYEWAAGDFVSDSVPVVADPVEAAENPFASLPSAPAFPMNRALTISAPADDNFLGDGFLGDGFLADDAFLSEEVHTEPVGTEALYTDDLHTDDLHTDDLHIEALHTDDLFADQPADEDLFATVPAQEDGLGLFDTDAGLFDTDAGLPDTDAGLFDTDAGLFDDGDDLFALPTEAPSAVAELHAQPSAEQQDWTVPVDNFPVDGAVVSPHAAAPQPVIDWAAGEPAEPVPSWTEAIAGTPVLPAEPDVASWMAAAATDTQQTPQEGQDMGMHTDWKDRWANADVAPAPGADRLVAAPDANAPLESAPNVHSGAALLTDEASGREQLSPVTVKRLLMAAMATAGVIALLFVGKSVFGSDATAPAPTTVISVAPTPDVSAPAPAETVFPTVPADPAATLPATEQPATEQPGDAVTPDPAATTAPPMVEFS